MRSNHGRIALSAAVALALGFGVREAIASPASEQTRRPYCSDQASCLSICERMYPGYDGPAICSTGHTCYC
jgi:hypothetical protein